MSYRIVYDSNDIHVFRKTNKRKHTGMVVWGLMILILGFLRMSGWGETLWQHMIPGDPEVTAEAFRNMSEGLKDGQSISEAVFVFCDTVIQGATLG